MPNSVLLFNRILSHLRKRKSNIGCNSSVFPLVQTSHILDLFNTFLVNHCLCRLTGEYELHEAQNYRIVLATPLGFLISQEAREDKIRKPSHAQILPKKLYQGKLHFFFVTWIHFLMLYNAMPKHVVPLNTVLLLTFCCYLAITCLGQTGNVG